VPCAEELLDPQQARAERGRGESKLAPVLAKIGGVLMLILYAIRGIFLLLYDWIKGLVKRKFSESPPSRPPSGGGPGTPGAGPPSAGGPLPNALRSGGGSSASKAQAADPAKAAGSTVDVVVAERPGAQAVAETTPEPLASVEQPAAEKRVTESAPKQVTKQATQKALQKPAKTASTGRATPKSAAQRASKATASKATTESTSKATPKTSAVKVQKKVSRRGIRLKTGDGDQTTFD
jgi:hypothetical protein